MKENNNEIDRVVWEYFNIFEEDLGFSSLYEEETTKKIKKRLKMNFKYFKAGFLFASIDSK